MGKAAEPSQTMTDFVAAVNVKMRRMGVSKSELARRTGIAVESLRAILNRRSGNCTFATAEVIADALDTSVLSLLQSAKRTKASI